MVKDSRPAVGENEWASFPGGELEGKRPKALCPACRQARECAAAPGANAGARSQSVPASRLLCFQCYRADLERNRALRAAATLNTASEERFQAQLPFEAVDKPRLQMLKTVRSQARVLGGTHPGGFADRRRRAQLAARRAVQSVISPALREGAGTSLPDRARAVAAALHAAELQLPESWIPFVVAR
jgi:hypothetical protein